MRSSEARGALHLVRHGHPLIDRGVPPARWELDPAAYDAVWALRSSGRLPGRAAWFSSPEPKALTTAQLLTDGDVGVLDGLREHVRESTRWFEDHGAVVERAFAAPDAAAAPGWEPLARCRDRVVGAVRPVLSACADGEDVVLVGHGTAWTVLVAALTGREPDLARWRSLGMPDVIVVPRADLPGVDPAG